MPLPDENPTYIKIDDRNFYLAKTTAEQLNVDKLQDEIKRLQQKLDELNAILIDAQKVAVDISAKP